VKRYELFKALKNSLKFDELSRVHGFDQHVINSRRESVVEMHKEGKTYEQIAKSLQIPEGTVRHDIDWYNENKRKKKFQLSTNS
jgi:DNA-binding NarL/FixJ family response regulator